MGSFALAVHSIFLFKIGFVPLLTPDKEGSGEGLTPYHWFKSQDFIYPFLDSLKEEPRSLNRISALGTAGAEKQFEVSIFAPDRFIFSGTKRCEYWSDFDPASLGNSIVFFDPDNGFETATQRGPKWVEHAELQNLFTRLPQSSVAVVYQHRPRRQWRDLFADITQKLSYVHTAIAAHDSNLAFVALAESAATGNNIAMVMREYADRHPSVIITALLPAENANT
jgi:hypothetical protein